MKLLGNLLRCGRYTDGVMGNLKAECRAPDTQDTVTAKPNPLRCRAMHPGEAVHDRPGHCAETLRQGRIRRTGPTNGEKPNC